MDHIRLLVLQPGSNDEPITCSLKTIPLDEAEGQYEAISYVWGKRDDFTYVDCDGKKFPVKTNLHDALQTFRHTTEKRSLWADAICINQKDHTEKGYQVRRMGEIYRKASRVLCWLGKDTQGVAKSCLALVRKAYGQIAREWQDGWDFENLQNDLKLPDLTKEDWIKFRSLLSLAWFERLW
jgi:hypothetical protein